MPRPFPWRTAGFTLLELMVVLLILGLIATFAVPQVMKYVGRANSSAAKIQIQNLSTVLDLYRLDMGRYPTSDEGLKSLHERPADGAKWNGPYVKKAASLVDPWGNDYRFRSPGEHGDYDLSSLGADNTEGGEGEDQDMTSW